MAEHQSAWPEGLYEDPAPESQADAVDRGLGTLLRARAATLEQSIPDTDIARGRKRLIRAISPIDRTVFGSAVGGFFGAAAASIAVLAFVISGLPVARPPSDSGVQVPAVPKTTPDRLDGHGYPDAVFLFRSDDSDALMMSLMVELVAMNADFSLVASGKDFVVTVAPLATSAHSQLRWWLKQNRTDSLGTDLDRLQIGSVTLVFLSAEGAE